METKNLLKSLKRRLSWLIMLTALLCGTQSVFGGTIPQQQYTYHNEGSPYPVTDFALTKIDNNHYKGSMTITGSSDKYAFTMKGADNKYYRNKGFWFGTNEEADISATDGDKMYIVPKWTSGKIDVSLELYCDDGGNSKLIVKQTQHTVDKCSNVDVTSILDGTNMMFYISQDYDDRDLCIHNGSKYISGTKIVNKKAYINTAVSDITGKTINVTNNCNNWTGTGGFKSVAAGSYLKTGNSTSTVAATTLSIFSTPTSTVSVGAASVAIKTKASSTTSSYGDDLRICFYIGDKSYGTCNATTTETSTNIDVSSLLAGTYTIKAVLSDSRIAYLDSKTITLTIAACTDPTKAQYTMASGQSFTYNTQSHQPTVSVATGAGAISSYSYSTDKSNWASTAVNVGTYYVKVNVGAGTTYCAANNIVLDGTFAITKADQAAFSISNTSTEFCKSAAPKVTTTGGSGTGAVTFSKDSGTDGITVNASSGQITANNAGTITVRATKAGGTNYEDATATKAFTINAEPAQPGVITEGTPSPCINATGLTYSITAVATATGYTWTLPDGWSITSGAGTLSITATAGTAGGDIKVTADNDCGPSAAQTLPVTVKGKAITVSPTTVSAKKYTPTALTATTEGETVTWAVTGTNNYLLNADKTVYSNENVKQVTVKAVSGGNVTATTINDGCETSATVTLSPTDDTETCN